MSELADKRQAVTRRAHRVRLLVRMGDRPRLSIHISNLHVTAQIIDDKVSKTLVYATTVGTKVHGTLTEKASIIGTELAQKAIKAGIKQVVFDRGAKLYQGRVKALADAARAEGLEF